VGKGQGRKREEERVKHKCVLNQEAPDCEAVSSCAWPLSPSSVALRPDAAHGSGTAGFPRKQNILHSSSPITAQYIIHKSFTSQFVVSPNTFISS
jgi:hypothetical protein